MEHLDKNLLNYVMEQSSDENIGLSSRITWAIGKQIMQAMLYLHSLENAIFHGDLKPDNILVRTENFGTFCLNSCINLSNFYESSPRCTVIGQDLHLYQILILMSFAVNPRDHLQ